MTEGVNKMKLSMPAFERASVLVVGDLMLDRYWHGGTSRISPEAPVPVVKVDQVEDRPGGAANVALNIAALGSRPALIGVLGRDEAGESLQRRLAAAAIAADLQLSESRPTVTKLRVTSRHQQLIRMDFESRYGAEDITQLPAKVAAALAGDAGSDSIGALVLSDYDKGTLGDCQALIALAKKAGVPVLVDPKGQDFSRYRGATLLTPNLAEFEAVVGACHSEQELVDRGAALLRDLELQALLITRGEHGMTLLRPDQPELHLPARAREVFDVTGAGDTVIAALAAAVAAGQALPEAVALANLAAGLAVRKQGTATVSGPELLREIGRELAPGRGVVSEEQLLLAVADARSRGERVVFTNGCFDILHAGHVGYLQDARQLGDRLIVAVNSDDSVRRLKGEGRPINAQDRRMAVLAGLEAVDWVTCFDDDTPERLLAALHPDVLAKGGDYSEDQVVGWQIVKGYGGSVKVLSFFDSLSTTAIVNRIREQP